VRHALPITSLPSPHPNLPPPAGEGREEARRNGEGPAPCGAAQRASWDAKRHRPFVVAIDGPSASGKGTLARRLAEHFGFAHLDTGRLYRATALLVLDKAGDPADPVTAEAAARGVDAQLLSDPRLRDDEVADKASVVAAIPAVRRALLALQQHFAAHPPPPSRGAVLDGRDIGTVVCPEADLKLFITASAETRACRRVKELREQGIAAIYETVLQDLNQRDARDSGRRSAPLTVAPDAEVIDTTKLDANLVFEQASRLVARTLEEKKWQQ
jgi:CMP/dCMP kinase